MSVILFGAGIFIMLVGFVLVLSNPTEFIEEDEGSDDDVLYTG